MVQYFFLCLFQLIVKAFSSGNEKPSYFRKKAVFDGEGVIVELPSALMSVLISTSFVMELLPVNNIGMRT